MKIVACVLLLASVTTSIPISQPIYPTTQYISDQQLQPLQLTARQPSIQYSTQPQYISSAQPQIYRTPAEKASTIPQPQHPPLGITQLLLPSAADKQVQKAAATIAGPEYAQQVQALQLQGLANQVQAAAQRRAQEVQRQAILLRQQAQNEYIQSVSQNPNTKPELQLVPQGGDRIPQNPQPQEDYDPNPSYQFGFDVKDDFYTNYQNRKEQRDGNKISGSYSVVDSDGFLRTVTYTADPKEGFKAEVNRQPTNIVVKIPKPVLPPGKQQYLEGTSDARPQLQLQKQRIIYQYQ